MEKEASPVKWQDPPERSFKYDWASIAKQLRRRPEKWGVVFQHDRASLVTAIRAGNISALKASKGFEITTSNNTRGFPRMCTLYMRYVPEKDTEREKE